MQIINEPKLNFDDVLIRPNKSLIKSRKEVSLSVKLHFKHSGKMWCGVPIIAANMDGIGTLSMYDSIEEINCITALSKETTKKCLLSPYALLAQYSRFAVTVGIQEEEIQLLSENEDKFHFINLDVANGYTEQFIDTVKKLREKFPSKTIMAGNVVTPEITQELIIAGADIVKVGIGGGSVCTTRIKTGVGYPQLSAIIECAEAAHNLGGHIISDGGCRTPGDIAKAFGAGADFVMLGGMLAGHDESESEIVTKIFKTNEVAQFSESSIPGREIDVESYVFKQRNYVEFYGMSSEEAMNKHSNGVAPYKTAEGKKVLVPYKGKVKHTMNEIFGGLRSACSYVGANELGELHNKTTFIRVLNGQQENKVFE